MSGYGKKPIDRGVLTSWRRQREELVRIQKDTDREVHSPTGDSRGRTSQDTERNRCTDAHSRPEDGKRRGLSGHGKQPTKRGVLTFWRRQREGLVRTWKETDRPRRTHQLETAEEGICQDTERNRPTESRSLSGDGRGASQDTENLPRERRTHFLQTAEGGTCQDTERNRSIEACSLPGDGRGRNLSGYRKTPTERCTHQLETAEDGLVRTLKETDAPRHTHILEMATGGSCQDMERNRPSEAYSLSGDGRGRDLSGHGRKPTNRGALTLWRRRREGLVKTRKEINRPRHTYLLEEVEGVTCQDT